MLKHKVVLTGGPHTGKTTLFESLQHALPEAAFVAEPATSVLRQTGDYGLLDDPLKFCAACVEWSVVAEAAAEEVSSTVVQDRSIVDTVAYARRDECFELLDILPGHIQAARYTLALVCSPVGEYAQSDVRTETEEGAAAIHNMLTTAYREFNIPMIEVPGYPIETRTAFVETLLRTE